MTVGDMTQCSGELGLAENPEEKSDGLTARGCCSACFEWCVFDDVD